MKISRLLLSSLFMFTMSAYANVRKENPTILDIAYEVLPYAQMSDLSYRYKGYALDGYTPLLKSEVPVRWQRQYVENNHSVNDRALSFSAIIFRKNDTKELVIAFKGAELGAVVNFQNIVFAPSRFFSQVSMLKNNLLSLTFLKIFGFSLHFYKADRLFQDLTKIYPDHEITFTGSSLGGGVAQYVALKNNKRAYIFNSLQISEFLLENLKNSNPDLIEDAYKNITVISLESDFITSKMINSSPYVGREFVIPNSHEHYFQQHTTDAILVTLNEILKESEFSKYRSCENIFDSRLCQFEYRCAWNWTSEKEGACINKELSRYFSVD